MTHIMVYHHRSRGNQHVADWFSSHKPWLVATYQMAYQHTCNDHHHGCIGHLYTGIGVSTWLLWWLTWVWWFAIRSGAIYHHTWNGEHYTSLGNHHRNCKSRMSVMVWSIKKYGVMAWLTRMNWWRDFPKITPWRRDWEVPWRASTNIFWKFEAKLTNILRTSAKISWFL